MYVWHAIAYHAMPTICIGAILSQSPSCIAPRHAQHALCPVSMS